MDFSLLWMTLPLKTTGRGCRWKDDVLRYGTGGSTKGSDGREGALKSEVNHPFQKNAGYCFLFECFFWSHIVQDGGLKKQHITGSRCLERPYGLRRFSSFGGIDQAIKKLSQSLASNVESFFCPSCAGLPWSFHTYIYIFQVIGWLVAYTLPFK